MQSSRFNIAGAYVALRDRDRAFDQLNKSFDLRQPSLAGLKVDSRFDGIRDDPRYRELLKKIGLPEQHEHSGNEGVHGGALRCRHAERRTSSIGRPTEYILTTEKVKTMMSCQPNL